jgi:hypothetical protein
MESKDSQSLRMTDGWAAVARPPLLKSGRKSVQLASQISTAPSRLPHSLLRTEVIMPHPTPTTGAFEREFLGIRCRLLELAAALDRIDRDGGAPVGDPRPAQIRRSLEILRADANRAVGVQMAFSLPKEEET